MDARAARTASALRTAVIRLASERPIDTVSAAELAEEAGITRRTLYNHTSSPQRLLVDLITPELDRISERFHERTAAGMSIVDAWARGDEDLAAHLIGWSAVYSAGIHDPTDHMSASLAHMLSDVFERDVSLLASVSEIDGADRRIVSRYVGHGVVGAIEAWLASADPTPGVLARSILSCLPPWLLRSD